MTFLRSESPSEIPRVPEALGPRYLLLILNLVVLQQKRIIVTCNLVHILEIHVQLVTQHNP